MNERGGAVYGLLAFIGAVVVLMVIAMAVCTGVAGAGQRPCDRRYDRCEKNHRGNFSPGPFDRSPVDVHDNTVCVSLDCSGAATTTTTRRSAS